MCLRDTPSSFPAHLQLLEVTVSSEISSQAYPSVLTTCLQDLIALHRAQSPHDFRLNILIPNQGDA